MSKRGPGAHLGVKLLRYYSIQGGAQLAGNLINLASVVVVAHFLTLAEFGRFGLLLFLAGLLNILFNLASKQGTLRRVFGQDEDEDEGADDGGEEERPESDTHTLGTGMALTMIISLAGTALVVGFAQPVSELLLGGQGNATLVAWAGLAGGAGAVFRLSSIVLWLERRPSAHVAAELARPILVLAGVLALVIAGAGLEGAIAGTALGTAAAAALALVLLRGSYEPSFSTGEAVAILRRGAPRIPIVLSLWTLGNADIFVLSRFVSDADLGTYQLASRIGILAAFVPGTFRIALRPLRLTSTFAAVQQEYGRPIARGQQLGYFTLVFISTVLAAALLADAVVRIAPPDYADAAELIPLLAAGLAGASMLRTVLQTVQIPNKRLTFIFSAVGAVAIFIGSSLLLIPELGLEGAPIAMLVAFAVPATYMLLRSQLSPRRIKIPLRIVGGAAGLAAACDLAYQLADPQTLLSQLVLAGGLFSLYLLVLVLGAIVPRQHRAPLLHAVRGAVGLGPRFDAERALRTLRDHQRDALRAALVEHRPLKEIGADLPRGGKAWSDGVEEPEEAASRMLVLAVRRVAMEAGTAQPRLRGRKAALENAPRVARFLFGEGTVAQRDATMRGLISDGVPAEYLRVLESTVEALARAPEEAWATDGRVTPPPA